MPTPSDEILDILTAYALDALEPEEMARVSELLANDPDLRALYAEFRSTAARLPYAVPDAAPRPELRQIVLDHAVGRTSAAVVPLAAAPQRGLRGWLLGLGMLAAVSFVAAFFAFAQLNTTQAQLAQVRSELERQIALNDQVAAVVARHPETVALVGTTGRGTVLRASDGEIVLAANLPRLAQGRVYQFWLIEGQNAPTSGGVFVVDADGSGLLTLQTSQTGGQLLFAITEEPGPDGSSGPTSSILISNIPAS